MPLALPKAGGVRGAVLLRGGVFDCGQPVTLSKDGVVLRGSGTDREETVMAMTGVPHACLCIGTERVGANARRRPS